MAKSSKNTLSNSKKEEGEENMTSDLAVIQEETGCVIGSLYVTDNGEAAG